MKLFLTAVLFIVSSLFVFAEETIRMKDYPEFEKCEVTKVIDGDTLVVNSPSCGEQRVRLVGVDAPENTKKKEVFGQDAKEFVEKTIEKAGGVVVLESDGFMYDRYNRRLSVVWAGGETDDCQINLALIRNGLATAYFEFPFSDKNREKFFSAQTEAKKEKANIWSDAGKSLPCVLRAIKKEKKKAPEGAASDYILARVSNVSDVGAFWVSSTGRVHQKGCRYYGVGEGRYTDEVETDKICGICMLAKTEEKTNEEENENATNQEELTAAESEGRLWVSSTGKVHAPGCPYWGKGNGHFYEEGETINGKCAKCCDLIPF